MKKSNIDDFTVEKIVKNMFFVNDDVRNNFIAKTTLQHNNNFEFKINQNVIDIDKKIATYIYDLNDAKKNYNNDILINESPSNIIIIIEYFITNKYNIFVDLLTKYLLRLHDLHNLFVMMKNVNTPLFVVEKFVEIANKDIDYVKNYKNDYDFVMLYIYNYPSYISKIDYTGLFAYEKFNPNRKIKNELNIVDWLLNINEQPVIRDINLYTCLTILLSRNDYIFPQKNENVLKLMMKIIDGCNFTLQNAENIVKLILKNTDINDLCFICLNSQIHFKNKKHILSLIILDNRFNPNSELNNTDLLKYCTNNINCCDETKLFFTSKIINHLKYAKK